MYIRVLLFVFCNTVHAIYLPRKGAPRTDVLSIFLYIVGQVVYHDYTLLSWDLSPGVRGTRPEKIFLEKSNLPEALHVIVSCVHR